jgi:hypothetical protein
MLSLRTYIIRNNYHFNKQIDKNNGYQIYAHDLTWFYVELKNAMYYRDKYYK